MTLLDKAARKFVEEVSDSLTALSSTRTEPPPLPVLFTPMLLVSILILSRPAVNTCILLAAATSSVPLLVALMRHREEYYHRSLAKTGVMIAAFSTIVAAPLLVTSPGSLYRLHRAHIRANARAYSSNQGNWVASTTSLPGVHRCPKRASPSNRVND